MEKEHQSLDEQTDNEDELLNFDLDDLSEEDFEQESSDSEEGIIELVDLVEEGEGVEEAVEGDFAELLQEEETAEEESLEASTQEISALEDALADDEDILGEPEEDLDVSDISLEIEPEEELELGPEEAIEEEIAETDLEKLLEEEEAEELKLEPESAEVPAEALEDLIEEEELAETLEEADLETAEEAVVDIMAAQAEQPEPVKTVAEPAVQELVGISEEKMEAIVTRVVQDVVERVARETMATVAEKVITEAIDALKQNLELSSD
jgi:hypothetical protein